MDGIDPLHRFDFVLDRAKKEYEEAVDAANKCRHASIAAKRIMEEVYRNLGIDPPVIREIHLDTAGVSIVWQKHGRRDHINVLITPDGVVWIGSEVVGGAKALTERLREYWRKQ